MPKKGTEEVPTPIPRKPEIPTKKPEETPPTKIPEIPCEGNHRAKEIVLPFDYPEVPKIPVEIPYEIDKSPDIKR